MTSGQHGGIPFKLVLLLALLALCCLLYLVRHPLLRAAGEFWVVDEPLHTADAVLLLSDDNYPADRAARAAELYHAGWAPRVVASGRQLRRYAGISELMQRDLLERGVPLGSVVLFPHTADSTREEAQALRRLVVERGWHRVVVVTSNYHTRRARYIFRRVFPPAVQVWVSPARDTYYDAENWWHSRRGVKIFFRETLSTLVAIWELRRHAEPAAAGSQVSLRAPCHPGGPQGPVLPLRHGGNPPVANYGCHPRRAVLYSRASRPLRTGGGGVPDGAPIRGGFCVAQTGRAQAISHHA